MRTVLEVALGEARFAQDRAYRSEMPGFAAMGGAGDREFFAREPKGVRRPREDQRQRLEGLGRRAQIDVTFGVPQGVFPLPLSVANDVTAIMDALDQVPAPDGDDRRVRGEGVGERGVRTFGDRIQLRNTTLRRGE
jgi:hypothetical protein